MIDQVIDNYEDATGVIAYNAVAAVAAVSALGDASSTGHTVTVVSGVATSSAQKKFGTHSVLFDGDNDYLTVPTHADWNFGTANFTIEYWIYEKVGSVDNQQFGFLSANSAFAIGSWSGASHDIAYFSAAGGGSWNIGNMSMGNRVVNNWSHIAITRSGTTFTCWRDGVQTGTITSSGTLYNSGASLMIGGFVTSGVNTLNGYMDEIRISNVARYTSAFTPSTTAFTSDANTKLLIHGDHSPATGKVTRIHGTSLAWK
jgi:hypothetical protein